jgi:hypothetical protein
VRSAVVVIVVRDALTDQRFVVCVRVSLWDICLCRGPSRTSVHRVRWLFGFKLSFRSLAFRVYCVCAHVHVCVRVLLQLRLWA